MPLKYRIVLKKDMSKGAAKGDQLYYGQIRSLEKTNFKKLCKLVSGYCTAKPGEVELVIDGLIYVLCMLLESGNVIQMGEFGNFRMVAGSKGSATLKNFDPMLFKKARIVFTPGAMLRQLISEDSYDRLDPFSDPEEKEGGEGGEGGSGEDDRPVIE